MWTWNCETVCECIDIHVQGRVNSFHYSSQFLWVELATSHAEPRIESLSSLPKHTPIRVSSYSLYNPHLECCSRSNFYVLSLVYIVQANRLSAHCRIVIKLELSLLWLTSQRDLICLSLLSLLKFRYHLQTIHPAGIFLDNRIWICVTLVRSFQILR